MKIEIKKIHEGWDGEKCLVHARGARGEGMTVVTAQYLNVRGDDLFDGLMLSVASGGGEFSEFVAEPTLAPINSDGLTIVGCDGTPLYHKPTGKILLLGHTTSYAEGDLRPRGGARSTFYSVFDAESGHFGRMRLLDSLPDIPNAGNGSGQSVVLDSGEVLVPVYYLFTEGKYASTVVKCSFDGETLKPICHGNILKNYDERGFCEPSVFFHRGTYYMTIRNDLYGYVATSEDGLNYTEPELWRWDDGEVLANYNTQQHFLTVGGELYLVYTRRGADNDHVFRHRAPLFISRVEGKRLVRSSEMAIVPERGARLGNFGAESYSDGSAAVYAAEWMQPAGCEKYGSANAIYLSRLIPDGEGKELK